jgi:hypothetical protein
MYIPKMSPTVELSLGVTGGYSGGNGLIQIPTLETIEIRAGT